MREFLQAADLLAPAIRQAEDFSRNDPTARIIRLAVVVAHPISGFWERMGFVQTVEVKPIEGRAVVLRSIVMVKSLDAPEQR